MELLEIYNLQAWADEEIVKRELIQKYSALQQALQQNSQRAQNQPPIPFNEQKKFLLEALNLVNIFGLSNPQLDVLKTINIINHIGTEAADDIKIMMTEHASDLAYLAEQINKYQAELQQGLQKISAIATSLEPIINNKDLVIPKDQILTRVTFKNEASINDINDLKIWTMRLYHITRGLSIACNKPVEEVKVIGASNGSLIFSLVLGRYIASILTKTLKEIFQCMSEYQNFKTKSHEAELAALKKDKFEQDYLDDKERCEERMGRVKQQVIDDLFNNIKAEVPDYQDTNDGELRKSVKDLVELISKGGDVDPVIPPVVKTEDEDETEENIELNESLEDLRQDYIKLTELKHNIKIEHFSDFSDDDDEEEENNDI